MRNYFWNVQPRPGREKVPRAPPSLHPHPIQSRVEGECTDEPSGVLCRHEDSWDLPHSNKLVFLKSMGIYIFFLFLSFENLHFQWVPPPHTPFLHSLNWTNKHCSSWKKNKQQIPIPRVGHYLFVLSTQEGILNTISMRDADPGGLELEQPGGQEEHFCHLRPSGIFNLNQIWIEAAHHHAVKKEWANGYAVHVPGKAF